MRTAFLVPILLSMAALTAGAQSSTQVGSSAKPAPAAKPPVHYAATGQPTAIIETTVGKMTCTLFPNKAPIGVENFIALATGTKDWKNPVSGATPQGMDSAADLPKITQALLDRGYGADDIKKILGGNLLRVFRQVETVSREMQAQPH